jgi:toxin ParE1/3/4
MAAINWTVEAERWLRDIYDYIAQDKPTAAANVVSGIYTKTQILRDFPEIGYLYRKEPDGDIRILLYGHYRVAYLIKKPIQNRRESIFWACFTGHSTLSGFYHEISSNTVPTVRAVIWNFIVFSNPYWSGTRLALCCSH